MVKMDWLVWFVECLQRLRLNLPCGWERPKGQKRGKSDLYRVTPGLDTETIGNPFLVFPFLRWVWGLSQWIRKQHIVRMIVIHIDLNMTSYWPNEILHYEIWWVNFTTRWDFCVHLWPGGRSLNNFWVLCAWTWEFVGQLAGCISQLWGLAKGPVKKLFLNHSKMVLLKR